MTGWPIGLRAAAERAREADLVRDAEPDDTAEELLSLYKALRSTPDRNLQQAIKDRIDLLIEQSCRSFPSKIVGSAPAGARKLDA